MEPYISRDKQTGYFNLTPHWVLRGWQDNPYALANTHTGQVITLESPAFFVASICDGKTNFDMPLILDIHHDICNDFLSAGIIEKLEKPQPIQDYQRYHKAPNNYHKSLHWSITGDCNLKCRHCYLSAPDKKYSDLDFAQITDLVNQMYDAGIMEVSITGGEPFLRKDLWQILSLFVDKKIRVTQIYTNGLLVTDAVLEKLVEVLAPQYENTLLRTEFSLSFDGVGCHDDIRGIEGTEIQTLEAIERIKQHGFPVKIETVLYSKNVTKMRETLKVLTAKKIDYWKISGIGDVGKWVETSQQETLSSKEMFDCYIDLLKGFIEAQRPVNILLGGFYSYDKKSKREGSLYSNPDGVCDDAYLKNYACNMSRFVRYVLSDGTLLPCISMTGTYIHKKMPNIRNIRLSEALQDQFLHEIVTITVNDLVDKNSECKNCEYLGRVYPRLPFRSTYKQ